MMPLVYGLIRAPDHPLNAAIRQAAMGEKCCLDPPFGRRVLARKYFYLACFLDYAAEHCWITNSLSLARIPRAKADTLHLAVDKGFAQ